MATVKEWIEKLQTEFNPDTEVCLHIWTVDDVMEVVDREGYNITYEEAAEIIIDIEDNIDSDLGVSWATVETFLSNYIERTEGVQEAIKREH